LSTRKTLGAPGTEFTLMLDRGALQVIRHAELRVAPTSRNDRAEQLPPERSLAALKRRGEERGIKQPL
jgi:hypothetical protein